MQCLWNDQYVSSDIMGAFVAMFNTQESKKKHDHPGYRPAVMIDSFFIHGLCFHANKNGQASVTGCSSRFVLWISVNAILIACTIA
jgi:hypothetical protein